MIRNIRILIVDDDADVLSATSRIIKSAGYETFEASSGLECLQLVGRVRPHLVLLDVVLPDADGIEICSRIKSDPEMRHTFILLISGMKTTSTDQATGLDGGADGFIARPVTNHELLARVKAMVRLLKTERTLRKSEKQLKASLSEKEILLRELYHRTKNNMQAVIAMLDLQSGHIEDDEVVQIFKATNTRIRAMALVHEKLYQTKQLFSIDLKDYFNDLIGLLKSSYKDLADGISIGTEMDSVPVTIEAAVPCGLIVNELVLNSLQHGFPEGRIGEIRIVLKKKDNDEVEILVCDNGVGLPEPFDYRHTDSFGLQSVLALAEQQLGGAFSVNATSGAAFKVCFQTPANRN